MQFKTAIILILVTEETLTPFPNRFLVIQNVQQGLQVHRPYFKILVTSLQTKNKAYIVTTALQNLNHIGCILYL